MAGILDSKSRVLDTIVTLEGRRQLINSELRIVYASFTDVGTYYEADAVSGSRDPANTIHFEQASLPHDRITFEANDSGRLRAFGSTNVSNDGQLLSYSFSAVSASVLTGANYSSIAVTGSAFASQAGDLLSTAVDNFSKLMIIGTSDPIFDDDGFAVGNSNIDFVVTNDVPVREERHAVNVNDLQTLAQDPRLSKVKNFRFLPPRNLTGKKLGSYVPLNQTHIVPLTPAQLESELSYFEQRGFSKVVSFDPTSQLNSIVGQAFEVDNTAITKLDVIDYGSYSFGGSSRRAFFIGKVINNDSEAQCFVHMFTLVFG